MGYTHGKKWDYEKIKTGILEVVTAMKLNRMPTSSEVANYYGNYSLASKVSKLDGGWYGLAKDLGLSIKESETTFGKEYEYKIQDKIVSMGFEVQKMSQNFPYDLLVNNAIKVDVKASRLYKGKEGNFYSFNLEKPYTTCDIYVLVAKGESSENIFVIPSKFVFNTTQISIGEFNSKYYKYKDAWSYLVQYKSFLDKVV